MDEKLAAIKSKVKASIKINHSNWLNDSVKLVSIRQDEIQGICQQWRDNVEKWSTAVTEAQNDIDILETRTDDMEGVSYKSLIEMTKAAQRSALDNLDRIRKRT